MRCSYPMLLVTAVAVSPVAPSPAWAEAHEYKVGDRVAVIAEDAPIEKESGDVSQGRPGQTLSVVAVRPESLKVDRWPRGWIAREHVLPLDSAIDYLTKKIEEHPDETLWLTGRANVWEKKREFGKAIRDYTEVLRRGPKSESRTYRRRAGAWAKKGEYSKAIRDYDAVIRIDPSDAMAYVFRGGIWMDKGEHDKAIGDYDTAIRLKPNRTWAYERRGSAWEKKGEDDKAISDYNARMRLNPKSVTAYRRRAAVWMKQGEFDKADRDWDSVTRLDPTGKTTCFWRAILWNDLGEYDKALSDYNAHIQLDPKSTWSMLARAGLWMRKGEYDKAIGDCNEAIRLQPDHRSAYMIRGDVRRLKGEVEQAHADYETSINVDATQPDRWNAAANRLATQADARLRNGAKAVEYAQQACELSGHKSARFLATLAAAYAETGEFDKAIAKQDQAIELASEREEKDYRARLALFKQGKPYHAEKK